MHRGDVINLNKPFRKSRFFADDAEEETPRRNNLGYRPQPAGLENELKSYCFGIDGLVNVDHQHPHSAKLDEVWMPRGRLRLLFRPLLILVVCVEIDGTLPIESCLRY